MDRRIKSIKAIVVSASSLTLLFCNPLFSKCATQDFQWHLIPASSSANLRTVTGKMPLSKLQVVNGTGVNLRTYWLDSTGKRRYQFEVLPNQSFTDSCYASYYFLITDDQDRAITGIQIGATPQSLTITPSAMTFGQLKPEKPQVGKKFEWRALPAAQSTNVRSARISDTKIKCHLENRTAGALHAFWMNYDGEKHPEFVLAQGQQHDFNCYPDHIWAFTDDSGRPLGSVLTGQDPGSFSVSNNGIQFGRATSASSSGSSSRIDYGPEPRTYFFAQNNDPRWNKDAPDNDANCAPTCLAMACRRFNRYPQGMNQNTSPQQLILAMRAFMTGELNQQMGTTPIQVANGAKLLGMKTEYLATAEQVKAAIDKGAVASIGGCAWCRRSYGPRFGKIGGGAGQKYPYYMNGHAVLVAAWQGGYFIVCDPLYFDGPINVSMSELEAFLSFHPSTVKGVAISI